MMEHLPNLVLLGTGGTIASTAPDATTLSKYSITESVGSLLSGVPEIKSIANVKYEQVFNVDSREITSSMLLRLAVRVGDVLADPDVDGVVITHGTDTLEETAYFLDLTLNARKPVIVVGAMRPSSVIGADGPINLYNALLLASCRKAWGKGVLVVMDGCIYAARYVSKMNTTRVGAFGSLEQGSLGAIYDRRVYLLQQPTCMRAHDTDFSLHGLSDLPSVEILYDYQGAGVRQYVSSMESGVRGIVVAGCGNGGLTPNAKRGLVMARRQGIACVRSSRVPGGVVTQSGDDARDGFVASNFLNPQKARILLMLALTRTSDRAEIQAYFDQGCLVV